MTSSLPAAVFGLVGMLIAPLSAQQVASNPWRDATTIQVNAAKASPTSLRTVKPKLARTLKMDAVVLDKALVGVKKEFDQTNTPDAELSLPLPDGTFMLFTVRDSPILPANLAAKYPSIKTYIGQGVEDPTATARIDRTPQGFHAVIHRAGETIFIDPYWRDEKTTYLSYRTVDMSGPKPFSCAVVENLARPNLPLAARTEAARPTGAALRTYRIAVGCTGEYAAAAGGGTVMGALGAIVTTVNRVSAVYERDLAIRLQLVPNEERLININATTDGYTNNDPVELLDENQNKLDTIIGNANYDVGHVFSTGGGGLAGLGVVGVAGQKAQGVTGSANPVGDPYDIDYVAHELGHQFGANHPFNGTSGSCSGGNRNPTTAYEPGSGTTIMAYAGICTGQDLQPNSDDYFHTANYDEIDDVTTSFPGNVGVSTPTGNNPPVIAPMFGRTIPANTPFALTASATDVNGDTLTYCWEEFDLGNAQNPTQAPRDNGSSPLFRSFDPVRNPTRYFPSLKYILGNANVPPALVGTIASGEFLPSVARTMNFRVTVRDNRAGGGGSNYSGVTLTVAPSSGFRITAPNTALTIAGGSSTTVSWAVGGTAGAPINTANVKISLSTDGGYTFPHVLAASVPNDGSQVVTIPNVAQVATRQGRIKVEAVGNIFFDISDVNLVITSLHTAPVITPSGNITVRRGTPTPVTANVATVTDPNTPLTVTVSNTPADTTITAAIVGGKVAVTATAEPSIVTTLTSRTYPFTITVADSNGSTTSFTTNLIVQPNITPIIGSYTSKSVKRTVLTTFNPTSAPHDDNGNLLAAPLTVTPASLPNGGTVTINQSTGLVSVFATKTTPLGVYPFRVYVQDTCGATLVRAFDVTIVAAPPLPIIVANGSSAPTAEDCLPLNSAVDPSEKVTVNFSLKNTGTVASKTLVATLLASGGVTPITTTQSYGVIAAGGSMAKPFEFTASSLAPCGTYITASFQIQDGPEDLGTITFPILMGVYVSNLGGLQNFDGVTAPALPAGWTSSVVIGTAKAWKTAASSTSTAPNSVFANTTATRSETRLESAPFNVTSPSSRITFKHRWNTEKGFDGGVLEVAYGTASFNDILAIGGSFLSGGYNSTIDSNSFSPIAGRKAWSGSFDATYTTTTVALPASAAGQTVRFRWRLASDESTTVTGGLWRIDSISKDEGVFVCCGVGPLIGGIAQGDETTAAAAARVAATSVRSNFERFIDAYKLSPANAHASADPDLDGITNLYEYALNLSPTEPEENGLPVVRVKSFNGVDYLSITYTRVTTATDVTYTVQASGDGETWVNVSTSVDGQIPTGDGFVEEIGTEPVLTSESRDIQPLTSKRFLRLIISKTP